ncbi:molybdopterin-dependent oxidoreductase [Cytobacillus sp. FJAT-54145]|uniref:Molybdopterin-dependent oxidoreductase n=1 Tax=Cytobacillus spartinae TaxID=3299023 RepID=A0ABW6K8W6_9BACI
MTELKTHFRTCPLCEATCGLEIQTRGDEVVSIRGDKLDPFSKGHICPKGFSLKELHDDPDRIRKPMIRKGDEWNEVSWDEAFEEVRAGLQKVLTKYGRDGVGVYLGNPNVHNLAGLLYVPIFLRALGSRYRFSASTLDQIPKQLVSEMMYGSDFSVPIADIDHTDYFMIIGANPYVSNGSMMTAPDMKHRLQQLRKRGGKFIVIDPVKTATAHAANDYYSIHPGTDAFFLFGLIHTLFEEGLVNSRHLQEYIHGLDVIEKLAKPFTPEVVQNKCGIHASAIRKLARDLAHAPSAAVYGRMGTCTQEFGTMNSWLIDLLNILTGNLDRKGGVLFPKPAAGGRNIGKTPRKKETYRFGRFSGEVRGLPEVLGELPTSCMADEIEGSDTLKAFITIAGNPILSSPNGNRLQQAFDKLDFFVSVDCYLNETTRHANVILPVPSPLERSHYDLSFYHLSVRNIAHYSKQVFKLPNDQLDEWEILLHLTEIVSGQELGNDPVKALDDYSVMKLVQSETQNKQSRIFERSEKDILKELQVHRGPERMLDFLIRVGPYGDHFGKVENGLTLSRLMEHEHGIDLGALEPRIPEVLLTSTKKIELAPTPLVKDVERLKAKIVSEDSNQLVLIGRRDLRSNNSWMHNLPVLIKGKERCVLYLHPLDAVNEGIETGDYVKITSRVGSLVVPVVLNEEIKQGVISLPHGWGHHFSDTRLSVASKHEGKNTNLLSDEQVVDEVSGNAVFNGIPVTIQKTNETEGENVDGSIRIESI